MRATARLWFGCLLFPLVTLVHADAIPTPITGAPLLRGTPPMKALRDGADSKVDATLLAAARALSAGPSPAAVAALPPQVQSFIQHNVEPDQTIFVVIRGEVTPDLISALRAAGSRDIKEFADLGGITANVPAAAIESLAQRADVRTIGPRQMMRTSRYIPDPLDPLANLAAGRPIAKSGSVVWQGVTAHQASLVRSAGITGAGVKVCVISDGVDSLVSRQLAGELPAVSILPGEAGSGDEGTAMLEIVNDMAPGAALGFATAGSSTFEMASNIRALRNGGCDIIVDDVAFFDEGPFQDDDIAQAVNTVTSLGAVYLSAAANSGNLAHGTSGTWEGDLSPYPSLPAPIATLYCLPTDSACLARVKVQSFAGVPYAQLTYPTDVIALQWADPLSGTANDYDVVVLNSTETAYYCTPGIDVQTGTQRPEEFTYCNSGAFPAGSHVYVVRWSGVNRPIRLNAWGGRIAGGTSGSTFGHNAAATAITVAAVDVRTTAGAFTTSNQATLYSSDGPRKMFFTPGGSEITPGNSLFATNGGTTIAKVDIAASDCGTTTTPGFSPFCGTSAAAPTAAAIAALVKSAKPAATRFDIANALATGALDIEAPGRDVTAGNGIVMAPAAVRSMLEAVSVARGLSPTTIIAGHLGNFVTQVTNPNAVAITGASVNMSFPAAGMGPNGLLQINGAGCTATKVDGVIGFTLTGMTIPANTTCAFMVPVAVGMTSGTFAVASNTLTTAIGLTSIAPGASFTVIVPPPLAFALSAPSSVMFGDSVSIVVQAGALPYGAPSYGFNFSTASGPIAGCTGVPLVAGTGGLFATCTTTALAPGVQHVTATYPGDTNYGANSLSVDIAVHVSTATSVVSSAPSSHFTQTVVFTSTVSAAVGTPTGTVQFRADGTVINGCNAIALNAFQAQCSTGTLASGTHTITAIYSGDATFTSTAGSVSQSVDTVIPPYPGEGKRLDFNGDGKSDIVWQLADGTTSIWLLSGQAPIGRGVVLPAAPGSVTRAAGFTGSGKTSLVREFADGSSTVYMMNGIDIIASAQVRPPGSGWHVANMGDFNGDGMADILWRHDDGSVQVTCMSGSTVLSTTLLMPAGTGWRPIKVADFDGDGKVDILWEHADGTTSIWLMDGVTRRTGGVIMPAGTGWHVTHVGDFDGDHKSDLLWRHDGDGAVSMWLMNGLAIVDRGPLQPANSGWSVMQVANLDGDSKSDIVWMHADGTTSAWIMSGRTAVIHGRLMPAGTGWSVAQVLDTAGDGQGRLIWTHPAGNVGLWTVDWSHTTDGSFTAASRVALQAAGNLWMPATSLEQNR